MDSLVSHYINFAKYNPLDGGSYIILPKELRHAMKGLINIQNKKDNESFRWCHIRLLNPQDEHPERVKECDRAMVGKLDYSGVEFRVTVKSYSRTEKQNSINVNVFGYAGKRPYPIYPSKQHNDLVLNLLLIESGETQHVFIKDFNRFMFNQTKHQHRKHFCMHCLQCFTTEACLGKHKGVCMVVNGAQGITMPEKGNNTVKFRNHYKQLEMPFVIYADFEALTVKVDSRKKSDKESYREEYQKHISCAYGYKVVCRYDSKFSTPVQVYCSEDVIEKFLEKMVQEAEWCSKIKDENFSKEMIFTDADKVDFNKAEKCHICGGGYKKDDIRIRDHCHITGKYKGRHINYATLTSECQSKYQLSSTILGDMTVTL